MYAPLYWLVLLCFVPILPATEWGWTGLTLKETLLPNAKPSLTLWELQYYCLLLAT